MKGIGGILKIYLLTRVKKSLEWQQEWGMCGRISFEIVWEFRVEILKMKEKVRDEL
jgi:hypothetical protein